MSSSNVLPLMRCESCGHAATIVLDDGSTWCESCDEAAKRLEAGLDRMNPGIFSSNVEMWSTPQALFDALDTEFGFTLDPCADETNAKCERYYTIADDGLAQPWDGVVFMNPPYGRKIGAWVKKAYDESLRGATVVCLIPARTDTAYWHDYAMKASEIRFIRGRLHFGGDHERTAHNAPFPSAVVIFRARPAWPALASMDRPKNGLRK